MGFFDQVKQLTEMKQKMDEVKKKLDVLEISAENDWVKVTVNGNRRIKNITILKTNDTVVLEGKIQSATNEALDKAETLLQTEFAAVTKGLFPNMPF
jgi:DNA-binding protein YbaB